jgi:hypothetical protein
MLKRTAQRGLRAAAVLAGLVAMLATATAVQARGNAPVETYTFDLPGDWIDVWGERRFEAAIYDWSTDADRDRIHSALTRNGSEGLRHAVRSSGFAGTIAWPGGLTYTVRYAYRANRADGGQDIVLIADRPAWMWWDQQATGASPAYPFTVFQLRLGRDGSGDGKASLTASVVADDAVGVALADYAAQSTLLANVRRDRSQG